MGVAGQLEKDNRQVPLRRDGGIRCLKATSRNKSTQSNDREGEIGHKWTRIHKSSVNHMSLCCFHNKEKGCIDKVCLRIYFFYCVTTAYLVSPGGSYRYNQKINQPKVDRFKGEKVKKSRTKSYHFISLLIGTSINETGEIQWKEADKFSNKTKARYGTIQYKLSIINK